MTARVTIGRVLSNTARQHWGRTGIGGLSSAYSAEGRPLRLIWLALFATGLVLTAMDVVKVISDYYDHPHRTDMEVVYDRSAHFPAVTVCSQSSIDCVRLVNASLNEPEDKRLGKMLDLVRCLKSDGLDCPYVWTLAAGVATADWLAARNASCLQCDHCSLLQGNIRIQQRRREDHAKVESYQQLFTDIGCNSTCPPLPSKQTSVGGGKQPTGTTDGGGKQSTGTADGGGIQPTGTTGGGGKQPTGTTDGGGKQPTGTTDGGGKQPTGTTDGGGKQSTGTADGGGIQPTGTTDGGGKQSTGTTDGGGIQPTGTTDGGVLKSRAKRSTATQTAPKKADPTVQANGEHHKQHYARGKLDPEKFESSQKYDSQMFLLNQYMGLSEEQRISIGVAQDDFIRDCSYLGTSCRSALLFRTTSSMEYGNCFTFNSNVTESLDPLAGARVTGLTGQQYSLELLLDLNHHTFPPLAATKGARVQVHQPDQEPDVGNSGMHVMPNAATSIAIEQFTIERLPYPYQANCISSWEDAEYFPVTNNSEEIRESYSTARCQKMCLQKKFAESCGCLHAKYPGIQTFRRRKDYIKSGFVRPCLLTAKGKDTKCTNTVQQQFDNGTVVCHCPPACFEKSFNTFQSMALWPRKAYMPMAVDEMGIDFRTLTPEAQDELAANVLQVKVFFKTLNTAMLSQSPSYSSHSLVSSLGGAMSLYLGISIIMAAEILELLCMLCWNLFQFARGRYTHPAVTPGNVDPRQEGDVKMVAAKRVGVNISYVGSSGSPAPPRPSYVVAPPTPRR